MLRLGAAEVFEVDDEDDCMGEDKDQKKRSSRKLSINGESKISFCLVKKALGFLRRPLIKIFFSSLLLAGTMINTTGAQESSSLLLSHSVSNQSTSELGSNVWKKIKLTMSRAMKSQKALFVEDALRAWWMNELTPAVLQENPNARVIPWAAVRSVMLTSPDGDSYKDHFKEMNKIAAQYYGRRYAAYEYLLLYCVFGRASGNGGGGADNFVYTIQVRGCLSVKTLQTTKDLSVGLFPCLPTDGLQGAVQQMAKNTMAFSKYQFAQCNFPVHTGPYYEKFLYQDVSSQSSQYGESETLALEEFEANSDSDERTEKMIALCGIIHRMLQFVEFSLRAWIEMGYSTPDSIPHEKLNEYWHQARKIVESYIAQADFGKPETRLYDITLRTYLLGYIQTLEDPIKILAAELAGAHFVQLTVELGWPHEHLVVPFLNKILSCETNNTADKDEENKTKAATTKLSSFIQAKGPLSGSCKDWQVGKFPDASSSPASSSPSVSRSGSTISLPFLSPPPPATTTSNQIIHIGVAPPPPPMVILDDSPVVCRQLFAEALKNATERAGASLWIDTEESDNEFDIPLNALSIRLRDPGRRLVATNSEIYRVWREGDDALSNHWRQMVFDVLPTRLYFLLQDIEFSECTQFGDHIALELQTRLSKETNMKFDQLIKITQRREWFRSPDCPRTVLLVFPSVVFHSLLNMRRKFIEPLKNALLSKKNPLLACWKSKGDEHRNSTILWQITANCACQIQPTTANVVNEWNWKSQEALQAEKRGTAFSSQEIERATDGTLRAFVQQNPELEPPRYLYLRSDRNFVSREDFVPYERGGSVPLSMFNIDSPQYRGLQRLSGGDGRYASYMLTYKDIGYLFGQRFRQYVRYRLSRRGPSPLTIAQVIPTGLEAEQMEMAREGVRHAFAIFATGSFEEPVRTTEFVDVAVAAPPPESTVSVKRKQPETAPLIGTFKERNEWRDYANEHPHEIYACFRSDPDRSMKIEELELEDTAEFVAYQNEKRRQKNLPQDATAKKRKTFRWTEYPLKIGGTGCMSFLLYCLYKYKANASVALLSHKNAKLKPEGEEHARAEWEWIARDQVSEEAIWNWLRDFASGRSKATPVHRLPKPAKASLVPLDDQLRMIRELYAQSTSVRGTLAAQYERKTRGLNLLNPIACEDSPFTRYAPALAYNHAIPKGERHRPPKRVYPAVLYFCVGDDHSKDSLPPEEQVVAVQRVYLEEDTCTKVDYENANENAAKKSAGPLSKANGFFWVQPGRLEQLPVVYLAEGPEKAKAIACASACACVYAALGVQNFGRFKRHLQTRWQDSPDGLSRPLLGLCLDYEKPNENDKEAEKKRLKLRGIIDGEIASLQSTGWTVVLYEIDPRLGCKDWDDVLVKHGLKALQDELRLSEFDRVRTLGKHDQPNGRKGHSEWSRYAL